MISSRLTSVPFTTGISRAVKRRCGTPGIVIHQEERKKRDKEMEEERDWGNETSPLDDQSQTDEGISQSHLYSSFCSWFPHLSAKVKLRPFLLLV